MNAEYKRKPIVPDTDKGVRAAWTIHACDGFETQIGTRLERNFDGGWRFVMKDTAFYFKNEIRASLFIQGVCVGRCLC